MGGAFTLAGATNDLLFFKAAVAGNTIYFASGTHTISVTNSGLTAGSITNPINLIGYNSSRSTIPTGDDRPLINCSGTTYFSVAGSWNLYHLRGTTATASYVFYNSSGASIWVNLKATNTYASGTAAMQMSGGAIFGSEVSCTHGTGIVGGPDAYACYAHDSVTGFTVNTATLCVAANCTSYGISASYVARPIAVNCTVYNCGTGVYCNLATIYAVSIINTIVSGCTTGINANSATPFVVLNCSLYNGAGNYGANVTQAKSTLIGIRTGNPGLTNPGSGDFSISASSDVYQQALDVMTYIAGITT